MKRASETRTQTILLYFIGLRPGKLDLLFHRPKCFSYLTFRPLLLVYFPVFIKEVALVPGSPQRGKPGEQGYFFLLILLKYKNNHQLTCKNTHTI